MSSSLRGSPGLISNHRLKEEPSTKCKDLADHVDSPIERIPLEVLESILYACLPDIASKSATISANHPSIALSHVCSVWRASVVDSPRMWTEMRIAISSSPLGKGMDVFQRKVKQAIEGVAVWKAKSRDHPLSVWVSGSLDLSRFTIEKRSAVRGLWDMLFAEIKEASPRWKELTIDLSVGLRCESLVFDLINHTSARLPILEKVSVEIQSLIGGFSLGVERALLSSGLASAPKLHSLKLHGPWQVTSQAIVWSQKLTSLDVDVSSTFSRNVPPLEVTSMMSAVQLIRLLEYIPTLVDVTFCIGQSYRTGSRAENGALPVLPRPIVAQHLETLTLTGLPVPAGFARNLSLPSLKNLHLRYVRPDNPSNMPNGPVECITLLSDRLKSLSFPHATVERAALVKIFDDLPNLSTLNLCPYSPKRSVSTGWDYALNLEGWLLGMLNEGWTEATGFMRVPVLHKLYLEATCAEDMDGTDELEHALIEFIAARRAGGKTGPGRLEEVVVDFPLDAWRRIRVPDVVRELERRGVDLEGFEMHTRYRGR